LGDLPKFKTKTAFMKLKFYFSLILILFFSFCSFNEVSAQLTPKSSRAIKFAESAPIRDLAGKTGEYIYHGKRQKVGPNGEVNSTNAKIIKPVDPNATGTPDAALFSERLGNRPVSANPPNPPSISFDGISFTETVGIGQGFLPPDVNGEVGLNHFVQTVNSAFRIWDKAGNPLTAPLTLTALFAPLGAVGTADDGDPIVLYDQLADRWIISQFVISIANPNNHQIIAVSKTGDPTGAYFLYDFMMPNNKVNDYPHFGMWPDGYYMTDNQFNQALTAFQGAGYFAFDRVKMLKGDPTAGFIYFDTCPTNTGCGIAGVLPADMDGFTPPAAGAPCPFVLFEANEFGDPADQLRIFDFHADFAVPANSTFTERTGSPLAVAAFDPRVPASANGRAHVQQPPPSTAASSLQAINDRLMFRISYRNFGGTESLIANHTVNAAVNPAYRAAVRFYQLNRTSPAGAFTVAEQQTFAGNAGDLENRWMGSGAINHQGDIALGYSVSSLTVFPSIRYAAKLGTDPAGSGLAQGEQTITTGAGSQTSTSSRWGDYSDMTIDPSDDATFWYTQMYYATTASAAWRTRIAKIAAGPVTTSIRGNIAGVVTNCVTGLPIPGAFIEITGGYSRSSSASGAYSAIVVPGTYTVTISAPGGYNTVTVPAVVVTNGNTTTVNACLVGIPVITSSTSSLVSESCVPANTAIDPNETVTVSLCILNTGGNNTANLVATLQATGGVTTPSGPQNYGVVTAGGASVCRNFTFTANAVCGANIIATLQLQDGAANLGTITYNFTTGVLTSTNYTTNNIAVPIPDNSAAGVDIPLTVTDVYTLADVNVKFRLNHTFDADLTISLVHPDNTVVILVAGRGGSGDNFGTGANDCSGTPTIIDDQASTAIGTVAAPFAGTFRPEALLSILNGKPSNGIWKLRIVDNAGADVGTVGCFSLELKRSICCTGVSPAPSVTINQAAAQADPTAVSPINFTVVFSEAVTGFDASDISFTGSTVGGTLVAVVTGAGPTYNVAVSGMTGTGTVVASIPAGAAINVGSIGNTASTSTDNSVGFGTVPTVTINQGATQIDPATVAPIVFDVLFSQPVTGFTAADISFTGSTATGTLAAVVTGSSATYTVSVSGMTGAGLVVASIPANAATNSVGFGNTASTSTDNQVTFTPASCTLTCPANITVNTTANQCGAVVTFPAPTTVGLCGTVTVSPASGSVFPKGTTTVTATSSTGATCNFTITVVDAQAPSITCPAAVTVSCASAVPAVNIASVTATDNCPGVAVTHVSDVISAQTCANRYTVTRTYRATDAVGLTATCTQIITVNDQTGPVIVCPANITQTTAIGSCTAPVTFTPTATDNCGGAVTITTAPASGSVFPIGTTPVTVTATDACGNVSNCTFNVIVVDAQPPVITAAPTDKIVCTGTSAVFSVTATGATSYQWQQFTAGAWTNIPGATGATYTVNSVTTSMNTNSFRVIVTGLCSSLAPTASRTLFVNPLPSIILAATNAPVLLPTQTTSIVATVNPTGGTFAWFKNIVALVPPVTGNTLSNLGVDNAGTYRAVYTDLNGCVSTSADLIVSAEPSIQLYVAPNPNFGQFWVRYYNQIGEKLNLTVYNSNGARVYQKSVVTTLAYTKIDVDLGINAPGIYIVELRNSAGQLLAYKRIIVGHR
jgi:subtilisin-like proprotein convertase family protein